MQQGGTGGAVETLLRGLATRSESGLLRVRRASHEASIHLRDGRLYAASMPGGSFLLGTRLVTSFGLSPEVLADALARQQSDYAGWRLGEILVREGAADAGVVDSIATEQVFEVVTEVFGWEDATSEFTSGEGVRPLLPATVPVEVVVAAVAARAAEQAQLLAAVGAVDAPLSADVVPAEAGRELAALLGAVAERREGLLASSHAVGLSLLEGARLAAAAMADGLLWQRETALPLAAGAESYSGGLVITSGMSLAPEPAQTGGVDAVVADHPRSYALDCLLALPGRPVEATVLDLDAHRASRHGELTAEPPAPAPEWQAAVVVETLPPEPSDHNAPAEWAAPEAEAALSELAAEEAPVAPPAEDDEADLAAALRRAAEARPQGLAATTPQPTATAGSASSAYLGNRLSLFSAQPDPQADTASLLRELSSLGDEDGHEELPAPHHVPKPAAPKAAEAKPEKKRKGLFGRG